MKELCDKEESKAEKDLPMEKDSAYKDMFSSSEGEDDDDDDVDILKIKQMDLIVSDSRVSNSSVLPLARARELLAPLVAQAWQVAHD